MEKQFFTKSILVILILLSLAITPQFAFSNTWVAMSSLSSVNLRGVWGSSSTDVFAVGAAGTILHYDGYTWSAMESGTRSDLYGIWGNSSHDVFAVGDDNIILHYNGSVWSIMPLSTTQLGRYYNRLSSVWGNSGTDVYAVGQYRDIDQEVLHGIIIHYNGITWTEMISETIKPRLGIWGSSGSDIFAVGWENILHYNGSTWFEMAKKTTWSLSGVWGISPTDIFAVGMNGLILRCNGSTWSEMMSGTTNGLFGVWGSSATDVFAVGFDGAILHFDGNTWSNMTSGVATVLFGVWGSSDDDVFAVGGWNSTILHYGEEATLIDLSSFAVTPSNREVVIQWVTASEINNAGFNLYRSESENGEYIKINGPFIPAKGISTQGASYEFTDTDVRNRKTYWYRLEDIDLNGTSTIHGPMKSTPRWIYGAGK